MVSLVELSRVVVDEVAAEEFLRGVGVLRRFDVCPFCGGVGFGRVRRGRYRCYGCGREWGARWGSVLEGLRAPLSKFVLAVKLFEMDLSVRQAARQLELAYNTVYDIFMLLRNSIFGIDVDTSFSGEIELDEAYFGGKRPGRRGRGAGGKIPVFGILERGGKVRVEVVADVAGQTLVGMALGKVRRGSLVYTDRFRSYDGLVTYGFRHQRIDHGQRFANGKVYINGIEGFWSYAKERLSKYHGLSPNKFPLYLKELEFRYNNRDTDLHDQLLQLLAKKTSGTN